MGCRQDMHNMPRYKPLAAAPFYRDGSSARLPVPGTVARGGLREDAHLYTGKLDGTPVATFPFPVTDAVMERGRDQYAVFCSPCHSRTGYGDGMVVRRGFQRPPTLHSDRLRQMPVGQLFDVVTTGFGAMPEYATMIRIEDRWAIVAYVRALQLSQHATAADLSEADRGELQRSVTAPK
jgi:mono/diheme cytochrome c family protein